MNARIQRTRYLAIGRRDGALVSYPPEPDTLDECLCWLSEPGIEPEAIYDSAYWPRRHARAGRGFLCQGRLLDHLLAGHRADTDAETQYERGLAQRRAGL